MDLSFKHITDLSPEILYQKAIEFEEKKDLNNLFMHMTASADKGYPLAKQYLYNDYHGPRTHKTQDHSMTLNFYEANCEYDYSGNYLGWFYYFSGIVNDKDRGKKLFICSAKKGNETAVRNLALIYEYDNKMISAKDIIDIYNAASELTDNLKRLFKIYFNLDNDDSRELIEYFISLGNYKLLNENLGVRTARYVIENQKLKEENKTLQRMYDDIMVHLRASPDGELFLEAYREWTSVQ